MPRNEFGQTVIDPRAAVLQDRAFRDEPIRSGTAVAGRFAQALSANILQQRTQANSAKTREEFNARLQVVLGNMAGGDKSAARSGAVELIGLAAASGDPNIQKMVAALPIKDLLAEEEEDIRIVDGAVVRVDGDQVTTLREKQRPTARVVQGKDLGMTGEDAEKSFEVKEFDGATTDINSLAGGGASATIEAGAVQMGGSEARPNVVGDLQKSFAAGNDALSRMAQIESDFRPEFAQVGTRWDEFTARLKDNFDLASPEEQQLINQFQTWKSGAVDNLNLTIKQLSGVATNKEEIKRIREALPDPGIKWYEGDSPTQFLAKLQRAQNATRLSNARIKWILSGQSPWDPEDIQSGLAPSIIGPNPGMDRVIRKHIAGMNANNATDEQIAQSMLDLFGMTPK